MRSGYPIKWNFRNFIRRYKCIAFDKPHLFAKAVPQDKARRELPATS